MILEGRGEACGMHQATFPKKIAIWVHLQKKLGKKIEKHHVKEKIATPNKEGLFPRDPTIKFHCPDK